MMTLTIEIPNELGERLRAEAEKHGQDLPEYLLPALEALVESSPATEETPPVTQHGPAYLEAILEAAQALPPEVVSRFPALGAEEVDHYVYGLPRKGPGIP
jgi:hypothetical protein